MAHFIGGVTVKELKRRMTHKEWMGWLDYFSRVGRVDVVRLYDRGFALLAWKIDQVTGNKSKITDYLPQYQEPEVDMPISDLMKMFGGVKKRG